MLTFDFETTNLDHGDAANENNRILMIRWQVDDGPLRGGRLHGPRAAEIWNEFVAAYNQAEVVCAFNAKFEQKWCRRSGLDVDGKIWHDPMLAELVLQGNRRGGKGFFSLGHVAQRYGLQAKDPVLDSMMKAGICPSEMPQQRLLSRCGRDVRVAAQLLTAQRHVLADGEQLHLYRTRVEFATVLSAIEMQGLWLDPERVSAQLMKHNRELTLVEAELAGLTGGVNMRSPDQLATLLYKTLKFPERTDRKGRPMRNKPSKQWPEGRPKTDKHTMAWLSMQASTPEQVKFLELKTKHGKLAAAVSKCLEFCHEVTENRGGRFYANFNQIVAATQRLSSTGIPLLCPDGKERSMQMQNMPSQFKGLFVPPPGFDYVVEIDGSQLEFRVAAYCGQDKQAMEDISNPDFDAHCMSASVMAGVEYETFLRYYREGSALHKEKRRLAKPHTFKPLFGGTRGTPAEERWYKEFQRRYAGVTMRQLSWLAEVSQTGMLRLPWGMVFYWPHTETRRDGTLVDSRTGRPVGPQVFNYPIQSLATAEMIPIAIFSLYRRCMARGLNVRFINTVHDSVVIACNEADITALREEAQKAFTVDVRSHLRLFYGLEYNVPLGMSFTAGRHWGEGEEQSYDEVVEGTK